MGRAEVGAGQNPHAGGLDPVGDEPPDGRMPAGGHDPDEPYRHEPAVAVMAARLADSTFAEAMRSWM